MVVGVLVGASAVFTGTSWLMLGCMVLLMTGYLASTARPPHRLGASGSTGSDAGEHRPLYWDDGDRS